MDDERTAVAERYARFARDEAPGRSDLYATWAAGVAADDEVQATLAMLPAARRQPPLVFAVSRMLGAPELGYGAWRAWVSEHADELIAETGRRSLQTNEPQRCAALLPALSLIDGPIALLEIGASAGLCLYPDRYSYRYRGGPSLDPPGGASPVALSCELRGTHPPRLRLPDIVWRAGVDLTPLNPRDAGDRRFLSSLVWPGEAGRAERITAALDIAATEPAPILAGDATEPDTLAAAIAAAPPDAVLVITTPGVLPHIPRDGRERLLTAIAAAPARWVSIDPPALHDRWNPPVDAAWGGFVLGLDGRPLAAVDPLGAFVEWRDGAAAHPG